MFPLLTSSETPARMTNENMVVRPRGDAEVDLYPEIGRLIKAARRSKKKTQGYLAEKVGLSRTSITNIELGQQKFLIETLWGIAKALRVPATSLLPQHDTQASTNFIDRMVPKGASTNELQWMKEIRKKGGGGK